MKYGFGSVLGVATMAAATLLTGVPGQASAAPDQFALMPKHSTNKCLDVAGSSQSNGAPVVQYDCKFTPNQRFWRESATGGYLIRAVHSDKCLGIQGDDARLEQGDCNSGAHQRFKGESRNGGYALKSLADETKCLDVWYGSQENGAEIGLYNCTYNDNQIFVYRSRSGQ